MGILDGIVEWIAEQVMAGLDLVTTSVLGALGCDMAVFLRYFPAAETMYSVFVALAIGIILLNWVWQLFKNFGLALLCDPGKTAELDRILLQGLTARQPGLAIEHDGISPDGSPVLFGYFCDLPRIARFNTSLELSERLGTLICFDFQAEVLRSYCGSQVRFQTIDFTKFEGRLFP